MGYLDFILCPLSAPIRSMAPNLVEVVEVEVDGAPQEVDIIDLLLAYIDQFLVA